MKKIIKAGATDQTLDIFVQDSSSTTGGGLTGLVHNSASLVCYYRKGATGTATALTLATQTVSGAHSDGGFVEIDATNMPGMYRLDLSDTVVSTSGSTSIMLKGAANMAPVTIELQVVAVDLEDSVRFGLTALPNAAADAAGGLPISDAGGLDLDAMRSDVSAVLVDTGTTLDAKIDAIDTIVDAILVDTDATIPALIDALPTAAENVTALMDTADLVETGLTFRNAQRLQVAAAAGKVSGANSTTVILRNAVADSKNRITATVDEYGNRSAITTDLT